MLKIKKILYPTDFSSCSKQAYAHALFIAEQYGAELHMLHVITIYSENAYDPGYDFPDLEEYNIHLEKHALEKSDQLIKEHTFSKTKILKIQERGYSPSAVILKYAQDKNIDLIVMGTHGRRGLGYLFLGSVAEEVTRFARRPVYTIREQKPAIPVEKVNRILVPIDLSKFSKQAVHYANELCKDYGAELEIIHVVEERIHPALYATGKSSIFDFTPEIREKSTDLIKTMLDEISGSKVKYKIKITEGVAAREILKHAEKNDSNMIVLTTHGASGLDQFFLGGVAEKVIRRSNCPVFTIKSFGKQLI
jgi:nucleotide-binding universal stress UspA family protein